MAPGAGRGVLPTAAGLTVHGRAVKIIGPQHVTPCVRRQRNDSNDAEAIRTAAGQPHNPSGPKKTIEPQDMQALFAPMLWAICP